MKRLLIFFAIALSVQSFGQNVFVAPNTFNDSVKHLKQAQYQGNYGSSFNTRSLVDKGYVDSSRNKARDSVVAIITALNVSYGVYTPSVSNLSNITSDARYSSTMFTRVGNVVTVSGKIQIVPTAAGATSLDLSLPVATNNFSDDSQAAGVGMYINGSSFATARIYANNATQTVKFLYRAPDTAVADFSFSFSYTIQ
jgi:hypothetical protein